MSARSGVRVCSAVSALAAAATGAGAHAGGAWDGLWYVNAAKSRLATHSMVLDALPDGRWKYDDGSSTYVFAPDGKPYGAQTRPISRSPPRATE